MSDTVTLNCILWRNYLIMVGSDHQIYDASSVPFNVNIFNSKHVNLNLPPEVLDAARTWSRTKYADMELEEFLDKILGPAT